MSDWLQVWVKFNPQKRSKKKFFCSRVRPLYKVGQIHLATSSYTIHREYISAHDVSPPIARSCLLFWKQDTCEKCLCLQPLQTAAFLRGFVKDIERIKSFQ
jgi:RNase P subunit RPR2